VVQTGPGEMSIYVQHHYGQPTHEVARYSLRLDGFAALEAPYAGGSMTTKALLFPGGSLEINAATSAAGDLRVELRDAAGAPIPGYGAGDCEVFVGNEIAHVMRWRGKPEIDLPEGQAFRLHFAMRDARLYGLVFRR